MRLWLSLLIILLSGALAGCGGSTTQARAIALNETTSRTAQEDAAPSRETTMHVVATDFAYALDASQANAGTVTFIVENQGAMPHDFAIRGNGVEQRTAMLAPGETGTLTVDLQPGAYTYLCTVPTHDLLGMKGTLIVNE